MAAFFKRRSFVECAARLAAPSSARAFLTLIQAAIGLAHLAPAAPPMPASPSGALARHSRQLLGNGVHFRISRKLAQSLGGDRRVVLLAQHGLQSFGVASQRRRRFSGNQCETLGRIADVLGSDSDAMQPDIRGRFPKGADGPERPLPHRGQHHADFVAFRFALRLVPNRRLAGARNVAQKRVTSRVAKRVADAGVLLAAFRPQMVQEVTRTHEERRRKIFGAAFDRLDEHVEIASFGKPVAQQRQAVAQRAGPPAIEYRKKRPQMGAEPPYRRARIVKDAGIAAAAQFRGESDQFVGRRSKSRLENIAGRGAARGRRLPLMPAARRTSRAAGYRA